VTNIDTLRRSGLHEARRQLSAAVRKDYAVERNAYAAKLRHLRSINPRLARMAWRAYRKAEQAMADCVLTGQGSSNLGLWA
jgi:hypothetical protein